MLKSRLNDSTFVNLAEMFDRKKNIFINKNNKNKNKKNTRH